MNTEGAVVCNAGSFTDIHSCMHIMICYTIFVSPHGATALSWRGPHYRGFTIAFKHTTVGRTHLDEWSARRRDLYLTTHNIHKRQDMHVPGGFRTSNVSKVAAADPPLRLRGHWIGLILHILWIYRVIQEESALLWEMIVWVILSKKVHTNMGPILNCYGVMGIF